MCHGNAAEGEFEVLGCDHAQAGAYLIGLWGLPDGVVEAIAFHHAPGSLPKDQFSACIAVCAANLLANAYASGTDESASELLKDLAWVQANPEKANEWSAITASTLGQSEAA